MISQLIVLGQAAAPAAPAAGANGQGGAMSSSIVFIGWIAVFGLMIFFMFRNQRKQAKQRQMMLDELKAGDRIVTAGGIYGKISKVKEKSFVVEIAEKVEIEVTKAGVSGLAGTEQESK